MILIESRCSLQAHFVEYQPIMVAVDSNSVQDIGYFHHPWSTTTNGRSDCRMGDPGTGTDPRCRTIRKFLPDQDLPSSCNLPCLRPEFRISRCQLPRASAGLRSSGRKSADPRSQRPPRTRTVLVLESLLSRWRVKGTSTLEASISSFGPQCCNPRSVSTNKTSKKGGTSPPGSRRSGISPDSSDPTF